MVYNARPKDHPTPDEMLTLLIEQFPDEMAFVPVAPPPVASAPLVPAPPPAETASEAPLPAREPACLATLHDEILRAASDKRAVQALVLSMLHAPEPTKIRALAAWAAAHAIPCGVSPTGVDPATVMRLAEGVRRKVEGKGVSAPALDPSLGEHGHAVLAAQLASFIQHGLVGATNAETPTAPIAVPTELSPPDRQNEAPVSTELSPRLSTELSPTVSTELSPSLNQESADATESSASKAFSTAESTRKGAQNRHRPLVSPPSPTNSPVQEASASSHPEPLLEAATATPDGRHAPGGSLRSTPPQPARRHRKRGSQDLSADQIGHVWRALRASTKRSRPLNLSAMLRLDLTPKYKSIWTAPLDARKKSSSPNSSAEGARRATARLAAANLFSQMIQNAGRSIPGFSYVYVFEMPDKGSAGLHVHLLAHAPDKKAAHLLTKRLAAFSGVTAEQIDTWRNNRAAFDEMVDKNHLPFDVRGKSSFLTNPDSDLMDEEPVWNAASYMCKSGAQNIPATLSGRKHVLSDIRPEQDAPKRHQRYTQPIRAYQPQKDDSAEIGAKVRKRAMKRLRFSRDLEDAALRQEGFTTYEDAGWMHRDERENRNLIAAGRTPTSYPMAFRRSIAATMLVASDPIQQLSVQFSAGSCYNNADWRGHADRENKHPEASQSGAVSTGSSTVPGNVDRADWAIPALAR